MKTQKTNDCIAHAIHHALTLLHRIPDPSLISNDIADLPLPYALLPQIGAAYSLYITEVPRHLPLAYLDPSCIFIIIHRQPFTQNYHAITSQHHVLYCPQTNTYPDPSSLTGNVLAIYLCQPALTLGEAYAVAAPRSQETV